MELGISSKQNTLLWHVLRESPYTISASEVPAVFFASPYKSRMRLFREKRELSKNTTLNIEQKVNEWVNNGNAEPLCFGAAQIGKDTEELARHWYMNLFKPNRRIFKTCGHIKPNDLPISFSPDIMEFGTDGNFITGVEIKTLVSRDVPKHPLLVFREHWLQCLASSICLKGLYAKEYKWRLIYYCYLDPRKNKIFDIRCNWDVAGVILDKICEFVLALKKGDEDYGQRRKNLTEFFIFMQKLFDMGIEIIEINSVSPEDTFPTLTNQNQMPEADLE